MIRAFGLAALLGLAGPVAPAAPTRIAPESPFAVEYSVSPAGDDAGDGSREKPFASPELFFDGEPMRLARWPNGGFVNGVRVIEPGAKNPAKPAVFEYAGDRHARWVGAEDTWLFSASGDAP